MLWMLVAPPRDGGVAVQPDSPSRQGGLPEPAARPGIAQSATGAAAAPEEAQAGSASAAGAPERSPIRVWEALDESSVAVLPAYKEVVQGRVLVRLAETGSDWTVGGELEFDVPQLGQIFAGVLERVEEDPWGNRSLVGLLREPHGAEHRFVMTLGARNQFANFSTSRGSFELVASNGLGWLMPTANMDQHVDYSRPDYRIRQRPGSR